MSSTRSLTTKATEKLVATQKSAFKPVKVVGKKVRRAKVQGATAAEKENLDLMFSLAAEIFRVMSAPMRLKIINSLCDEEKNVGQLLAEIDTTQPNMSQHLNTLFKAKILGRRREGVQIYYRIINDRVVTLCRAVCAQIAIDSDIAH
jgi:ArsR family transcriptional regulator